LKPKTVSAANKAHHGTTPRAMKAMIRGVRSPTASAMTAVACGPIVTGATRQSPSRPPRSHIRQTNLEGSRSTGIFNFRTNHSRKGAPAKSTTAPPAT
jgi:hypothetical protein